MSMKSAENLLREILSNVGTPDEEIEHALRIHRGKCTILQVIEKCLELTPSIEKACQQAIDKHEDKKK